MKKKLVLLLSVVLVVCSMLCACTQQSNFEENLAFDCYYNNGILKIEIVNNDPKDITSYDMTVNACDGNGTASTTLSGFKAEIYAGDTITFETEIEQYVSYIEIEMTNINNEGINISKTITTWETRQEINNILKEKGY